MTSAAAKATFTRRCHITKLTAAIGPPPLILQHKQRQGIHTDAAGALMPSVDNAAAAAAAAVAAARTGLDAGSSVGMRLWQQLL